MKECLYLLKLENVNLYEMCIYFVFECNKNDFNFLYCFIEENYILIKLRVWGVF